MAGLTIYRASAGSGKTFAITREYIHLLFRDPDNYRHILGVTFTNKATAEMKNRILKELDKLAKGDPSAYAENLSKSFNLNESEVIQKAKLILQKILHDYSHFNILTIDSFFQRVIRVFAREIGYYQGFDVELDQDRIFTAAVDKMIFELDANLDLKDWLVSFAEEKIVEGSNWNFDRDIERLGREVFKENFKEFGETLIKKITDKQFLNEYNQKLIKVKSDFEKELQTKAATAFDIIRQCGLTAEDFKSKSTSIAAFFERTARLDKFDELKISPSNRKRYNDIEEWMLKSSPRQNDIAKAFSGGANRLLGEIIKLYDEQYPIYLSVLAVQKHLYVLGMVADLLTHIHAYTSDKNLFLISDTAQFLQQLVSGADAPFVYERTGTFIHHFMIDEFQDTSALQWNNFRPLLLNSMSEHNENWIVGDVKQSIYRWRNSDWTILSERIFDDVQPFPIHVEKLEYNWRSSRNIVSFNNSFFQNALSMLMKETSQEESMFEGFDDFERLVSKAYNDFTQLVPEHKTIDQGLVEIRIIPKDEDKDVKFEDQALEYLVKTIEDLQRHHHHLKDIAILVRERSEGDRISEFLIKYQKKSDQFRYDILSNDSLLLKNSEVVKWIISVFSYIVDPDDQLNKSFLAYEYNKYLNSDDESLNNIFDNHGKVLFSAKLEEFFNQSSLKQHSVYEFCDKIILFFGLSNFKNELPFIQAFQDMLQDYMYKEPSDLNSFLNWWEENRNKRVISMPDDQDAIRLMTFHSAKGLEFKTVIIPFANWYFMKSGWNSNILWCKPDKAPFNTLELLPVSLSKGLQNTIFRREYFHEKALAFVDNLNLLYVGFTRAIDSLYVFVPEPTKDSIENNLGNLITMAVKNHVFDPSQVSYPAIRLTDYWNQKESRLVYGALSSTISEPVIVDSISLEDSSYTINTVSNVVKQVSQTEDYFTEQGEMLASRINAGKVMHEVFQRIKTSDDIDEALRFLLLQGKIVDMDVKELEIKIKALISTSPVSEWFSPDWKVLTEADILLKGGSVLRPDRVLIKGTKAIVIDYKFGESEHPSHQWQVKNYMRQLTQMNYKDVHGFLWYVNLNKVTPIPVNAVQGKLF